MKTRTTATVAVVGLGYLLTPVIGGLALRDVCTWDNTGGGAWNDSENWDPREVPDSSGESAVIPNDGFGYTIELDMSPVISWISIQNPQATLNLNGWALVLEDVGASANRGVIVANGSSPILYGDLENRPGGEIQVPGGDWFSWDDYDNPADGVTVLNDGVVTINADGAPGIAKLRFHANVTLTGVGELVLNDDPDPALLETSDGVSITHEEDHLIHGHGDIFASMSNKGEIVADATRDLWIHAGVLTGDPGEITFVNESEGWIRSESADLHLETGDRFRNEGNVVCEAGRLIDVFDGDYLQTAGRTTVEGELRLTNAVLRHQGGWLRGHGLIGGSVEQTAGALLPGDVFSTGDLTIGGDYDHVDGGLFIDLASETDHDVLYVDGDVILAGTLYLYTIQQYIPPEAQEFVILWGGTVTGEFDDVWSSGVFDIVYNPDNVTAIVLIPPKPADINGDGVVNVSDFLFLLFNWGPCPAECPPCDGDINYDCVVDVIDFLALIANWDPLP